MYEYSQMYEYRSTGPTGIYRCTGTGSALQSIKEQSLNQQTRQGQCTLYRYGRVLCVCLLKVSQISKIGQNPNLENQNSKIPPSTGEHRA